MSLMFLTQLSGGVGLEVKPNEVGVGCQYWTSVIRVSAQ